MNRQSPTFRRGDLQVARKGSDLGQSPPTRKRIRLPTYAYIGPAAFSITIATAQRAPTFQHRSAVDMCLAALSETAARHSLKVLAYCFMPDHLHLLVEANQGANLIRFMKAFKQVTSFRYKKQTGRPVWQKGYYDHILRDDEHVLDVAAYILGNPVRQGLAASVGDYPFCGGELAAGDLKVAPTPSHGPAGGTSLLGG